MNRRKFLLASGGTIFTGISIGSLQNPVIGINFEISRPQNKDPSNVDSIILEFNKLEITPKYIDDNKNVTVRVNLELDGHKTKEEIDTKVKTGETKDISNTIGSMFLDGISLNSDYNQGKVTVNVEHPDITNSYTKKFAISSYDLIGNWNIDNSSANGFITDTNNTEVIVQADAQGSDIYSNDATSAYYSAESRQVDFSNYNTVVINYHWTVSVRDDGGGNSEAGFVEGGIGGTPNRDSPVESFKDSLNNDKSILNLDKEVLDPADSNSKKNAGYRDRRNGSTELDVSNYNQKDVIEIGARAHSSNSGRVTIEVETIGLF